MALEFNIPVNSGGNAENAAFDTSSYAIAMSDLMNSPSHKKNILNAKYQYVGIAYSSQEDVWIQLFMHFD